MRAKEWDRIIIDEGGGRYDVNLLELLVASSLLLSMYVAVFSPRTCL